MPLMSYKNSKKHILTKSPGEMISNESEKVGSNWTRRKSDYLDFDSPNKIALNFISIPNS